MAKSAGGGGRGGGGGAVGGGGPTISVSSAGAGRVTVRLGKQSVSMPESELAGRLRTMVERTGGAINVTGSSSIIARLPKIGGMSTPGFKRPSGRG